MLALLGGVLLASASPSIRLLEPSGASTTETVPTPHRLFRSVERRFRVAPDVSVERLAGLSQGARIRLDLTEGMDVVVLLKEVAAVPGGGIGLNGVVEGFQGSLATVTASDRDMAGSVHVPGLGDFDLRTEDGGDVVVTRTPAGRSPRCATCAMPEARETLPKAATKPREVREEAKSDGVWDPSTPPVEIDVILFYTPKALAAHGDEEELKAGVLGMVSNANRAYANSGIGVRLNPRHVGLHPGWVESGNMIRDHGAMYGDSRINSFRNDYKADFVYLVIESDRNGYSGAGTLLSDPQGNPDFFFSIMRRGVFVGNPRWAEHDSLSLTHETGHMLGAGHDVEHGYPSAFQGTRAAFTYANGYRFEAGGVTYRTAMAYDPGIQLNLFSSPDRSFAGVPLGIAVGRTNEADNVSAMNRIAPKVAAYRVARSRIGFREGQMSVDEAGGSVRVVLERSGDLDGATRVSVLVETASTAKPNLDYTRPSVLQVAFATNQASAEIVFPILQDELAEGDEFLRLGLVNVVGEHGLGTSSTCVVRIVDDEPGLVVDRSEQSVPEDGGVARFEVEYRGAFPGGLPVEIPLGIGAAGDTAASGADYAVVPNRLVFTTESRRQAFEVRSLPDDAAESDETARIGFGTNTVVVRILDGNRAGSLRPVAAPDGNVIAIRALADGGTLIGGDFRNVGGTPRTGIARLLPDGALDTGFVPPVLVCADVPSPEVPPAKILCLTRLSDGNWLAGGTIGLADGIPAGNLVRMKSDGRLDTTFRHPGFDGTVVTVVEQSDGRLLVGGTFDHVGGRRIRGLVRLNPDGTVDEGFLLRPGSEGVVVAGMAIGLLPDGRILAGGRLEGYNGTRVRNLVRLNPDGSVDPTFPLTNSGPSTPVYGIAVLPDGRAYVAGYFDSIGGRSLRRLVRLNADGSLDLNFRAPDPNAEVVALSALPNGQLLVVGAFTNIAGANRRGVALLNADGSIDPSLDLGDGGQDESWAVAASAGGDLLVGGPFRRFNRQGSPHLVRLRSPRIDGGLVGIGRPDAQRMRARVQGLPGGRYQLEYGSELGDWSGLGEIRLEETTSVVDLPAPDSEPRRFYRLRATP